jgi:hypothetical protein
LYELHNAIASIEARMAEASSDDPFSDAHVNVAGMAETAHAVCHAAHNLYGSLAAEALDRGASPSMLDWADPRFAGE